MSKIELAEGLSLPDDAATQVFALMGRRGMGKTYAAGRLIEQLYGAGNQVVILDPVGNWWGLRLAKDGKKPGIKIAVFGGDHGDIPLLPTAGAVVAKLVAEQRTSLVLDVSGFTLGEQRRFVADFATALFQEKKKHPSALFLALEEAQEFAPQSTMESGDMKRMLGAIQRLAKLGRNYGVGMGLLSQRPQEVNKAVLNLCELLATFQLTGPQERKTVQGWVQQKGIEGREDVAGELPSLPRGTALVWSPEWLKIYGRYRILPKWTYDASATPTNRPEVAGDLAPIDLDAVRAAMAATIEAATKDDPKALRAEIAKVKRELDEARRGKSPGAPKDDSKLQAEVARLHRVIDDERRALMARPLIPEWAMQEVRHLEAQLHSAVTAEIGKLERRLARANAPAVRAALKRIETKQPTNGANGHHPPPPRPVDPRPSSGGAPTGGNNAEAKILRALAARHPTPLTKVQLATLAGYAAGGGGFNNALSSLKTQGRIQKDGDAVTITEEGLAAAGPVDAPATAEELVELWSSKLSGKGRDLLRTMSAHPRVWTKDELAQAVEMDPGGGGFNNYMSALRSNALIVKTGGGFRITEELAL